MRFYSFEELTERYGLSKGGFSKFFHANEDKLIKNGSKTYNQEGKKIIFTQDAVDILDELRGLNADIILAKSESANEIRIRELLEETNTLKTQLLLLQDEGKRDKERIIALMEKQGQAELLLARNNDLQASVSKLEETKKELVEKEAQNTATIQNLNQTIEDNQKEIAEKGKKIVELVNSNNTTQQTLATKQAELEQQQAEIKRLKDDLEAEKNKSWWQKLWGN